MDFSRQGRPLSAAGMSAVCALLDVGEAEIWALLEVETRGFGFLRDRRPAILFERHQFSKRTNGRFDRRFPDIAASSSGGYLGGAGEYDRLRRAMDLDETAALHSTSWGLGQVMGFHHRVVGFDSVHAMIDAIVDGEDSHIAAVGHFIHAHPKCLSGIRRGQWGTFAACYNGPDFQRNHYDVRLAAAHAKYRRLTPHIGLRAAQAALTYLGFHAGEVDGLPGPRTRSGLRAFQHRHGLSQTGELDPATETKLMAEAFPSATPRTPAERRRATAAPTLPQLRPVG